MALLLNANDTVSRSYSYTIPSPNHVSEVQAVGDRTGNLFDILTVYSDTTKFTINKNSVTATGRNFNARHIKLSDVGVGIGDAFVFSANILNSVTGVIGRVCASIGGVIKQGFYKDVLEPYVSSITGTMETNEDAIWISYGNTGEINVSNIMLNEGSTALPYEPYGYKIPVVTKSDGTEPITTPIYLPTPLYSGEVLRSDGTITRSDGTTETFTAPQIPTINGTTVIDVDTAVKPESMTIKYRR